MTRIFAVAAIVSLTIAAQAEPLSAQTHAAVLKACTAEAGASRPVSHYGAITRACVDRVSATISHKLAAQAQARLMASTASAN